MTKRCGDGGDGGGGGSLCEEGASAVLAAAERDVGVAAEVRLERALLRVRLAAHGALERLDGRVPPQVHAQAVAPLALVVADLALERLLAHVAVHVVLEERRAPVCILYVDGAERPWTAVHFAHTQVFFTYIIALWNLIANKDENNRRERCCVCFYFQFVARNLYLAKKL